MISKRPFFDVVFIFVAFHLLAARALPSGCDICASTGQCDHAYKNMPGQFCGSWYDIVSNSHRPCCCPTNSICKVSQLDCRCHVPENHQPQHQSHSPYHPAGTGGGEDPYWVVRLVGVLFLLCCCCCCIPACFNRKTDGRKQWGDSEYAPPEATPVVMPYPGNPPPTAPGWTPEAEYGSTGQRGLGGGGGGGLGPALGGLAVGTVVGNMLGQRRDGYFGAGGVGGGGGGYDIAGDSGVGGGGYDIAGDSGGGGGGYDIAGDS